MKKKVYKLDGMHCTSCSLVIEGELEDLGVDDVEANYVKQVVQVEWDPSKVSEDRIVKAIEKQGYRVIGAA